MCAHTFICHMKLVSVHLFSFVTGHATSELMVVLSSSECIVGRFYRTHFFSPNKMALSVMRILSAFLFISVVSPLPHFFLVIHAILVVYCG